MAGLLPKRSEGLGFLFLAKGDEFWANLASSLVNTSRSSIPMGEKSVKVGDSSSRGRLRGLGVLTISSVYLVSK